MNTTTLFRVSVVVLLGAALVSALFIFRNDDDGLSGSELKELQDYYAEVNQITAISDTEIQNLRAEHPEAETDPEAAKIYYQAFFDAYQRFIDNTDAIEPPDTVSPEHEEFVSASLALQSFNFTRLQSMQDAATIEEIEALFETTIEYSRAVDRQQEACADLGDVAKAFAIEAPSITRCDHPVVIEQTVEPSPS